jgi:hypothetical protein
MNTPDFSTIADDMIGLSHNDVFQAFAREMGGTPMAILHMHYPEVDERNHKSLDTLVAALSGHGFTAVADSVAGQTPVLVTYNLEMANRVLHEIQRDSVAISATLWYRGLTGVAAEERLLADFKAQ